MMGMRKKQVMMRQKFGHDFSLANAVMVTLILVIVFTIFLGNRALMEKLHFINNYIFPKLYLKEHGNGVMFVETTDRMEPSSLVLCALESAARVYPDRPVVFFMKGLENITSEEEETNVKEKFPSLRSFDNIYIFPLRLEELFEHTPLQTWFENVDPKNETYWTHVLSDACRFAMMWKYGGLYMDTDVISTRPIPDTQFLAAEEQNKTSSSVFALSQYNKLTWRFMKDFVQNYRGDIWGHQGPQLFSRVVTDFCGMPIFHYTDDDLRCKHVPYLHPYRFYPLSFRLWWLYFRVWEDFPSFEDSYGLHVWNYMNRKGKVMEPGSNTLMEHLYRQYCPTTYSYV